MIDKLHFLGHVFKTKVKLEYFLTKYVHTSVLCLFCSRLSFSGIGVQVLLFPTTGLATPHEAFGGNAKQQ